MTVAAPIPTGPAALALDNVQLRRGPVAALRQAVALDPVEKLITTPDPLTDMPIDAALDPA